MTFDLRYDDTSQAERRKQNFAVRIEPCHTLVMENEFRLDVTHNGFQWQLFTLTPDEAVKVIDALQAHIAKQEA